MATVTFAVSTTSTSNQATYTSGTFTPATGDLLVVFVVASGTVAAGTLTESLGQTTFTKVTSAVKNSSADTIYAFIANSFLTSSGSRTVAFDCTGDQASGTVITVYRIAGMSKSGTNGIKQSAIQSNQAAGTPAPSFSANVLTTNPTLGVVGNATSPATLTPPTNWTEGADNGYSTPTTGSEVIHRNSGFTGTTITWGSSSASAFGAIVLELDAASLSQISGNLSGSSGLNQTLTGIGALTGHATGVATASDTLTGTGTLIASPLGAGVISGTLTNSSTGSSSAINATTSLSALLTAKGVLAGSSLGSAVVVATLKGTGRLLASPIAAASVLAAMQGTGAVGAHITAQALVSGALTDISGGGGGPTPRHDSTRHLTRNSCLSRLAF